MKTVCLYFQVHQPWRLKKYRFFNMGKDHNYLDDLLNRSIMQKVARQCYLPMNALLLKLIRENKGKFRCSFSITFVSSSIRTPLRQSSQAGLSGMISVAGASNHALYHLRSSTRCAMLTPSYHSCPRLITE